MTIVTVRPAKFGSCASAGDAAARVMSPRRPIGRTNGMSWLNIVVSLRNTADAQRGRPPFFQLWGVAGQGQGGASLRHARARLKEGGCRRDDAASLFVERFANIPGRNV